MASTASSWPEQPVAVRVVGRGEDRADRRRGRRPRPARRGTRRSARPRCSGSPSGSRPGRTRSGDARGWPGSAHRREPRPRRRWTRWPRRGRAGSGRPRASTGRRSRARSAGVSANEATMIASALRRAGSVVKNSVPLGLVEDAEDQQLVVGLAQPAVDRVQDRPVEPAVQRPADQHRDPPEPAGGQPGRAARDGEARARSAAARTRAAVVADTRSEPRRARDTVATETPARAATSAMVAIAVRGTVGSSRDCKRRTDRVVTRITRLSADRPCRRRRCPSSLVYKRLQHLLRRLARYSPRAARHDRPASARPRPHPGRRLVAPGLRLPDLPAQLRRLRRQRHRRHRRGDLADGLPRRPRAWTRSG